MLFPLLALAVAACPPERAHYTLRDDPRVTARFLPVAATSDWPSGLALRLHFAGSGREVDFLPFGGGSAARQHLASTGPVTSTQWQLPSPDGPRPLGDVEYIGADASYRLLDEIPRRGGDAPVHFLLPDLREALWYREEAGRREAAARQFFDLTGCGE
ncbi:hypothetical protein ARC20_04515 [Stenotrophomonas panacihumi]|uniref:Uncharacterized protein n=1 Tax=Stenotrophomonas panacihumi TaxID=676599 RepID=A0A0R0AQ30_9GAMM|nr:hypothetical protein [Stenotrophomonas panacihumi]KRG46809.1 hypothetical protein ARC20_04515 [Stenotrophomonas panacihumi]PTN53820.1 hypothetical protein C9J98_13530 [Stenotrophomonas panacihumi]